MLILCSLYSFFSTEIPFLNVGTLDVSCGMFSNVASLVLKISDTASENDNLIRRSISDGLITCNSKGVSLIGI